MTCKSGAAHELILVVQKKMLLAWWNSPPDPFAPAVARSRSNTFTRTCPAS